MQTTANRPAPKANSASNGCFIVVLPPRDSNDSLTHLNFTLLALVRNTHFAHLACYKTICRDTLRNFTPLLSRRTAFPARGRALASHAVPS